MSATDEVIAGNVARLRKKAGLSQKALAEAMQEAGQPHWHQTTVSRIEAGRQSVTFGEVRALTSILGSVIEGTGLFKNVDAMGDAIVMARLRDLEVTLANALEEIRELQAAFEDEHG